MSSRYLVVVVVCLQELLPQMVRQWPNIFTNTTFDSFWCVVCVCLCVCVCLGVGEWVGV